MSWRWREFQVWALVSVGLWWATPVQAQAGACTAGDTVRRQMRETRNELRNLSNRTCLERYDKALDCLKDDAQIRRDLGALSELRGITQANMFNAFSTSRDSYLRLGRYSEITARRCELVMNECKDACRQSAEQFQQEAQRLQSEAQASASTPMPSGSSTLLLRRARETMQRAEASVNLGRSCVERLTPVIACEMQQAQMFNDGAAQAAQGVAALDAPEGLDGGTGTVEGPTVGDQLAEIDSALGESPNPQTAQARSRGAPQTAQDVDTASIQSTGKVVATRAGEVAIVGGARAASSSLAASGSAALAGAAARGGSLAYRGGLAGAAVDVVTGDVGPGTFLSAGATAAAPVVRTVVGAEAASALLSSTKPGIPNPWLLGAQVALQPKPTGNGTICGRGGAMPSAACLDYWRLSTPGFNYVQRTENAIGIVGQP